MNTVIKAIAHWSKLSLIYPFPKHSWLNSRRIKTTAFTNGQPGLRCESFWYNKWQKYFVMHTPWSVQLQRTCLEKNNLRDSRIYGVVCFCSCKYLYFRTAAFLPILPWGTEEQVLEGAWSLFTLSLPVYGVKYSIFKVIVVSISSADDKEIGTGVWLICKNKNGFILKKKKKRNEVKPAVSSNANKLLAIEKNQ